MFELHILNLKLDDFKYKHNLVPSIKWKEIFLFSFCHSNSYYFVYENAFQGQYHSFNTYIFSIAHSYQITFTDVFSEQSFQTLRKFVYRISNHFLRYTQLHFNLKEYNRYMLKHDFFYNVNKAPIHASLQTNEIRDLFK